MRLCDKVRVNEREFEMSQLALLVFPLCMAYGAMSDLLTMRLANKLVIITALSFFVLAFTVGMPLEQIGWHVLVAFAVLVVTFAMFAFGWIGGGDAKFAAATALWLGPFLTVVFLLYSGVFGGMLTLLILSLRRQPLTPFIARMEWLERLHNSKSGVPYGIAMAVAGLLVYAQSTIFEKLIQQPF
jgi:prepilin peptidase CpaA